MAEVRMEKTEVVRELVQKWFEYHFVGNACIMCTLLGTLQLGHCLSMTVMNGKTAAYVVVECSVCGHTLFFNAETIGVLKPST